MKNMYTVTSTGTDTAKNAPTTTNNRAVQILENGKAAVPATIANRVRM
jgi:hypothetical protein